MSIYAILFLCVISFIVGFLAGIIKKPDRKDLEDFDLDLLEMQWKKDNA